MKHIKTFCLIFALLYCAVGFAQMPAMEADQIDILHFDPSTKLGKDMNEHLGKANTAYAAKDYETAARYYLAHLQFKPEDSNSWYNLSCCFGLLGNAELASKYLLVAYKAGFKDVEHVQRDTDFEKVRQESVFVSAMDSLSTWQQRAAHYQGKMEYFPLQQFQPYYLHLPATFDPTKSYNLVIGLHGFGDRASKFSGLWRLMEKEEIIFVIPSAPYAFPDNEGGGFSWSPFVPQDSELSVKASIQNSEYIIALSKHLKKEYKIKQSWLLGFSQGAYMSYIFALKNPKAFDGIVACGGGLVTEVFTDKDYKAAKNLKILISHGTKDMVVPYTQGDTAYSILKDKGFNVQMHSFDGAHNISKDIFPLLFQELK